MKFLLLICLFSSFPLYADELYSMLNTKLTSPPLLKEAIAKGKDRASLCKYCHGVTGNSKRGYIPNLASQNAKYLLHQFELFASGQRKDKIMSELASNLNNSDRVNIALYYSTQKVKASSNAQAETHIKGKKIFHTHCASCHGTKGHGKELLPRIAGQPAKYLKKTLRSYQTNSDRRPNSPMQGVAATLSKDELESVVAFIASMK